MNGIAELLHKCKKNLKKLLTSKINNGIIIKSPRATHKIKALNTSEMVVLSKKNLDN